MSKGTLTTKDLQCQTQIEEITRSIGWSRIFSSVVLRIGANGVESGMRARSALLHARIARHGAQLKQRAEQD